MTTKSKKKIRKILAKAIEDGNLNEDVFNDASAANKGTLINALLVKNAMDTTVNTESGSLVFFQGEYLTALPAKWNDSGSAGTTGDTYAHIFPNNPNAGIPVASEAAYVGSRTQGLTNDHSGSWAGAKFRHYRFVSSSQFVSGGQSEDTTPGRFKDITEVTLGGRYGTLADTSKADNVVICYSPNFPYPYVPKFGKAVGMPDDNDQIDGADLTFRAYLGYDLKETVLHISASGQTENTSSMGIWKREQFDGLYCQAYSTHSVSRAGLLCLQATHDGTEISLTGGYTYAVGSEGFYTGGSNNYLIRVTASNDSNHPPTDGTTTTKTSVFLSSSALYPLEVDAEPDAFAAALGAHISDNCGDDFVVRVSGSLIALYTKELGYRGYATVTSSVKTKIAVQKFVQAGGEPGSNWTNAGSAGDKHHFSGSAPFGETTEGFGFQPLWQGSGSVGLDPAGGYAYANRVETSEEYYRTTGSVRVSDVIAVEVDLSGSKLAGNDDTNSYQGVAVWMSGSNTWGGQIFPAAAPSSSWDN